MPGFCNSHKILSSIEGQTDLKNYNYLNLRTNFNQKTKIISYKKRIFRFLFQSTKSQNQSSAIGHRTGLPDIILIMFFLFPIKKQATEKEMSNEIISTEKRDKNRTCALEAENQAH